jgi:predicted secreted Zn-dependent protease
MLIHPFNLEKKFSEIDVCVIFRNERDCDKAQSYVKSHSSVKMKKWDRQLTFKLLEEKNPKTAVNNLLKMLSGISFLDIEVNVSTAFSFVPSI